MVLFIDTHLNDIVIILYEDGKIVVKKIIENVRDAKYIMPAIKECVDIAKIESIIVVNGPGSFTGVRIGVTIAKTLAYTLNIPIRVVSYLKCMSISLDNVEKTVSFNDPNGYYIGKFTADNKKIDEYFYLSNLDYEKFITTNNVYTNVLIDYKKVIEEILKREPVNCHSVKPIYVKKIDVEK